MAQMIFLIADYLRDENVRSRFRMDPQRVLDEYGLDSHTQSVLRGSDRLRLAQAIIGELAEIHEDVHVLGWPPSDIKITRSTPEKAFVGVPCEVTVIGEKLPATGDAKLICVLGAQRIFGANVTVHAHKELKGTVTLPAPGTWQVAVTNANETDGGKSPNDIDVTEKT
jgi:hypothetical protein